MNRSEINWTVALAGFALLWCGILLGVSFLATPAKFLAPSLTLPVALDVGRQTFMVFNRLEWLLCVAAAPLWVLGARSRTTGVLIAIACGIVLIETFWLLPLLDARVGLVIRGQAPEPSSHLPGISGWRPQRLSLWPRRASSPHVVQSGMPDGNYPRNAFDARLTI
jgi:hypothetical protein